MLEQCSDDQTVLLEVGSLEIWWPADYDYEILPLIWAELFVDYPPNGHQYLFEGSQLPQSGLVVDVGASEGFFGWLALKHDCSVLAIEPLAPFVTTLRKTFSTEIESGRMEVLKCALGAESGPGLLQTRGSEVGTQVFPRGAANQVEDDSKTVDTVNIERLDKIVDRREIDQVGFLKMDVEGYEVPALEGAVSTIARDRPVLSIASYHYTGQTNDIIDFLDSFDGYEIQTKGCTRVESSFVPQVVHAWPNE